MTKNESQELKGIAILLMLFLHLFNHEQEAAHCDNYLFVNGIPLVHLITRMANPVPFFVILSGYGLYATYKKGDKHRWSRLFRLLSHYWLILIVFVTIGHFVSPAIYPGNWVKILENLTSFYTSYNGEHWFLFPYLLLAVTSPWLFKLCDKMNVTIVLAGSYFLYLGTCFIISRYGAKYLYTHMWAYHPVLYGSLLFNFLLGALAYKQGWLTQGKFPKLASWSWLLLISLCVIRCFFTTGAFHNLYVFAFIMLWLQTPRVPWVKRFFAHIGEHSMNLWFIHSFYCYYLFHDWIYGFRYPLLIYLILITVSYLSSIFINFLYSSVALFFPPREKEEKKIES
ncbi:MAG: acyltransferase family protein [Bacteroidaceae bacterium]|nr:acyltransferase family protein [Bacteroidaceae bacterium]